MVAVYPSRNPMKASEAYNIHTYPLFELATSHEMYQLVVNLSSFQKILVSCFRKLKQSMQLFITILVIKPELLSQSTKISTDIH